jgi:hypothetical protein
LPKPQRVRRGATKPEHASVAVEYRCGWFYSDGKDQATKPFFRLLSTLLSSAMADSALKGSAAPILTVPVSR